MSRRIDSTTFAEARQAAQARRVGAFATGPSRVMRGIMEPDLAPTDPRLQPFHDAAVCPLSRFICRELTREQLAVILRDLARTHHVERLVRWEEFPI